MPDPRGFSKEVQFEMHRLHRGNWTHLSAVNHFSGQCQWETTSISHSPALQCLSSQCCCVAGDLWAVPVRQEDWHLRGGGHVRAAHGHHPQGVPHAHGDEQRPEPRVQRGVLCLQEGRMASVQGPAWPCCALPSEPALPAHPDERCSMARLLGPGGCCGHGKLQAAFRSLLGFALFWFCFLFGFALVLFF